MKAWSGRFDKATDPGFDAFQRSIGFDRRLFRQDIAGSRAHARMLARQGILTDDEAEQIVAGLEQIGEEIESGGLDFDPTDEDIHMAVERLLTERIGDVGKKLHTARSRNDQVATDVRMYLKTSLVEIEGAVCELQRALVDAARRHKAAFLPGYTHLQRAQPVLFGHHLLAYVEMLERDRGRLADCYRRTDACPLGSGALAGVAYPVDRAFVARELGFTDICHNSLDAVSDRDFAVEFLAAASLLMVHLSRFCEEVVLWSSQEFGFIELDDAFATGSSIMPQKKNPDIPELVRGKTGRVAGDLVALLTVLKGLPLAYNKDMQEDKEPLFDAVDTLTGCLAVLAPMVQTWHVRTEAMAAATRSGFLNATDLADALVGEGVPFRDAHRLAGGVVRHCVDRGIDLESLTADEWRRLIPQADPNVLTKALQLDAVLAARRAPGGTAPEAVEAGLARAEKLVRKRMLPLETSEIPDHSGD